MMKRFIEIVKGFGQRSEIREPVSCCGGGGQNLHHGHKQETEATTIYQCPMKCEGDKTYSEPGKCPVCGMYLAPVNEGSLNH